jgi:hypothetical protein
MVGMPIAQLAASYGCIFRPKEDQAAKGKPGKL